MLRSAPWSLIRDLIDAKTENKTKTRKRKLKIYPGNFSYPNNSLHRS